MDHLQDLDFGGGEAEENGPLVGSGRKMDNNIKMYLKGAELKHLRLIYRSQDGVKQRSLLNMVIKLLVP